MEPCAPTYNALIGRLLTVLEVEADRRLWGDIARGMITAAHLAPWRDGAALADDTHKGADDAGL